MKTIKKRALMNSYTKIKTVLSLCFFILCTSFSFAQDINETWIKDNYCKKEYMIKMRDGISLYTAVYTPNNSKEHHPILMTRTPYSCSPYGIDKMNNSLWNSYLKEYVSEEYIFVFQDVRGKYMSEGEFENIRPFIANKKKKTDIDESSDTYDTVDWLIGNIPNNNGKVGIYGTSYPGFYSTMAAASGHPAIKAASLQAPVFDWFMGDDFHHNGAFMLRDAFHFFGGFGQHRPKPTTKGARSNVSYSTDDYSFFLNKGNIAELSKLYGDSIQFWNDMMNHPNYDGWWQARSAKNACYNLKPAILVVGGLFDAEDCHGTWQTYKAIAEQSKETDNRIVVGPWHHGGWNRPDGSQLGDILFGENTSEYYQQKIEIPFFNYHLKGVGDLSSLKKAIVFFSGENNWKEFDQWPSDDVQYTDIYLTENQSLQYKKPTIQDSYSHYISDPNKPVPFLPETLKKRPKEYMVADQRFASQRPDVLCFETGTLEDELTLAGPITIDLKVAISSTDADFVVKIIDVFPNDFTYAGKGYGKDSDKDRIMAGYQMMVRGDVMRGKYRNSFSHPEAFVPDETTSVRFELPDIAHTFGKGHKLMIQIQSTWFPLVDRNPQVFTDIYHCQAKDFVKTGIKIFHDKNHASKITLPIFK